MGANNFLRHVEAKSHSAFLFRIQRVRRAPKRRRRKTGAGIGKTNVLFRNGDGKRSAFRHGLDGVQDDVVKNLAKPVNVRLDAPIGRGRYFNVDFRVISGGCEHSHRLARSIPPEQFLFFGAARVGPETSID